MNSNDSPDTERLNTLRPFLSSAVLPGQIYAARVLPDPLKTGPTVLQAHGPPGAAASASLGGSLRSL